jgi:type IV secretory pathway TrbF-like protein
MTVFFNRSSASSVRLSESPSAPPGLFRDPIGEFAEIYGSALVGQQRMFLIACLCVVLAFASFLMYVLNSRSNIAVPWIVEVNERQGIVSKPVKVEPVRPADAVLKAELAKWIEKVFTIDQLRTRELFGEANVMTSGLGTEQFREFRIRHAIAERMNRDKSLQRRAEVRSVDVSTPGVAFIFLGTQEAQGTNASAATGSWRVTLKYDLIPPQSEKEILANPLGLFITSMNVTEEEARR